jgi:hypothetical protein
MTFGLLVFVAPNVLLALQKSITGWPTVGPICLLSKSRQIDLRVTDYIHPPPSSTNENDQEEKQLFTPTLFVVLGYIFK